MKIPNDMIILGIFLAFAIVITGVWWFRKRMGKG